VSGQEIKNKLTIKDVMTQIDKVVIPLKYLPSKVRIPRHFISARVTLRRPGYHADAEFYFLISENAVIDMEKKILYYKTRSGRIYSLKISEEELPKELSRYTNGVDIFVASDTSKESVSVLVNLTFEILRLQGNIEDVSEEKFIVSLLFYAYNDILIALNH